MDEDIRWLQRFDNFTQALKQLKNAVDLSKTRKLSELESQGLIQAFEYTHELAWKTMKDFLEEKGNTEIFGSKDATRQAFKLNLIENGEVWMDMIKSRNLSTHTYNPGTVSSIKNKIIGSYIEAFIKFENRMNRLKDEIS